MIRRRRGYFLTVAVPVIAAALLIVGSVHHSTLGSARANNAARSSSGTSTSGAGARKVLPDLPGKPAGAPLPSITIVPKQPLTPPSFGGQILTPDQLGGIQMPFDVRSFIATTYWEDLRGSRYIGLVAGSVPTDPMQGVLKVVIAEPDSAAPVPTSTDYPAPSRAGALRLTSVVGNTATVISTSGQTYLFDLARLTFQ